MKQGIWSGANQKQLAVKYYAPFYLFLSLSDADRTAEEKRRSQRLIKTPDAVYRKISEAYRIKSRKELK